MVCPVVELNDSDRFISGGERREETVRRLVVGVVWCGGALAMVSLGEGMVGSEFAGGNGWRSQLEGQATVPNDVRRTSSEV